MILYFKIGLSFVMRRSVVLCSRRAKGRGWYGRFMKYGEEGFQKYNPPTPFNWEQSSVKRIRAYLDIRIEKDPQGRLVFELANDIVPNTVANFVDLCGDGKFSYRGSPIHNILKGVLIMGGDVENKDGTGSHSANVNKRYFDDENFIIPHSGPGLLSMVSTGVHSNGSQFYISSKATPHLNGRSVVLGRLVGGEDVIKSIEKVA